MVKLPPSNKQAIIDAYMNYFSAYTQRDWDKMVSHFAKDSTMFGTGIDEVSTLTPKTLNFFKREFEQSPDAIEYKINRIEAFITSPVTAYLIVQMDMKISAGHEIIDCPNNRSTVIMVMEEGKWKIAHGHWSQPAEGQEVGESIPYKLLKERNKLLEESVLERTRKIEKQNIELKNLNDVKTKLLSIIAHDLRSPFNALMGLTELMLTNFENNLDKPDYFKAKLEQIYERSYNLYCIADNLLNWAWTQTELISVNWRTVHLKDLLNQQILTLEDISRSKEIVFKLDGIDDVYVNTDSEILGIIIRNFFSNAIKYSYRGSAILILIKQLDSKVLLSITDNGVGMDQEKLSKILTANNLESNLGTENERGTGLGLKICRDFLEKINGTLCIASTPNVGTTISITLPLS